MRLTKFNPETGLYEYKEKAKTQAEYNEQRKAVIQKLGEFEDRAEWISVEDRLPTNEKNVLCYYGFDRGDGDLGMMFMGTLCYFCFDPNPHWQHADHNLVVTHWMPLPEPPKMKGAADEQR